MTLLELVQRLWVESGRLGAGPTSVSSLVGDQARALNRIKDAWREIQLKPQWWAWMRATATVTLTDGQYQYTTTNLGINTNFASFWPETSFYRPQILDSSNVHKGYLDWAPYEEFRFSHLETVTESQPLDWSIAPNGDLLLGPAPNNSTDKIKIDYKTKIQELSASGDIPLMPTDHHMLIVWMALEQMAMADEDPGQLRRAANNRRREMGLLMNSQADNPTLDYATPLA